MNKSYKQTDEMLEKLIDIIFPKSCLECKKQGEGYICSTCFSNFKDRIKIEKIFNKSYEYLIYLDKYKQNTRKNILSMKFSQKAYMAEFYGEIFIKSNMTNKFLKNYDYIIPVPMNTTKKKERGYNQTELLANYISKATNVTCLKNVLIKNKNNKTQSLLEKSERYKNVFGVFKILNQEILKNKKVILIDDIYTTGATVFECAKVLKLAGVQEICALVIAKS